MPLSRARLGRSVLPTMTRVLGVIPAGLRGPFLEVVVVVVKLKAESKEKSATTQTKANQNRLDDQSAIETICKEASGQSQIGVRVNRVCFSF